MVHLGPPAGGAASRAEPVAKLSHALRRSCYLQEQERLREQSLRKARLQRDLQRAQEVSSPARPSRPASARNGDRSTSGWRFPEPVRGMVKDSSPKSELAQMRQLLTQLQAENESLRAELAQRAPAEEERAPNAAATSHVGDDAAMGSLGQELQALRAELEASKAAERMLRDENARLRSGAENPDAENPNAETMTDSTTAEPAAQLDASVPIEADQHTTLEEPVSAEPEPLGTAEPESPGTAERRDTLEEHARVMAEQLVEPSQCQEEMGALDVVVRG